MNRDIMNKYIYATSTKLDGNMSATFGLEQALTNRSRFIKSNGLNPSNLVILKQVHGDIVVSVDKIALGLAQSNTKIADADAMVTNDPTLVLTVFTADCVPIFFYDNVTGAFGIAHAGRKGTVAGIAKNTVLSMRKNFGAQSENIKVTFGPCIHACHYELQSPRDAEKIQEFQKLYLTTVVKRGDRYYIDLIRANTIQLKKVGILQDNIDISASTCTAEHPDVYWSYHKIQKLEGSMMSIIGKK